jgi:hypothetical protein
MKLINVYLRVNRKVKKGDIVIASPEKEIARYHKQNLAPGEMITVGLPSVLLPADGGSDTLNVSLEVTEA